MPSAQSYALRTTVVLLLRWFKHRLTDSLSAAGCSKYGQFVGPQPGRQ